MADDDALVELLKFYKQKATVTRPEVGVLTGKSVGQIAGVCNRAGIKDWPKLDPNDAVERPCQFPVIRHGERYVCGLMRSHGVDADPLRCGEHRHRVWDPAKDT
jgi:hypothetical protein